MSRAVDSILLELIGLRGISLTEKAPRVAGDSRSDRRGFRRNRRARRRAVGERRRHRLIGDRRGRHSIRTSNVLRDGAGSEKNF